MSKIYTLLEEMTETLSLFHSLDEKYKRNKFLKKKIIQELELFIHKIETLYYKYILKRKMIKDEEFNVVENNIIFSQLMIQHFQPIIAASNLINSIHVHTLL